MHLICRFLTFSTLVLVTAALTGCPLRPILGQPAVYDITGTSLSYGAGIKATEDGGFLVSAVCTVPDEGDRSGVLYTGPDYDVARTIYASAPLRFSSGYGQSSHMLTERTSNGDFLLAGYEDFPIPPKGVDPRRLRVARFDSSGNAVWATTYAPVAAEPLAVFELMDGRILVVVDPAASISDDCLIYLTAAGELESVGQIPRGLLNSGVRIRHLEASPGAIVIAGEWQDPDGVYGNADIFVHYITRDGVQRWSRWLEMDPSTHGVYGVGLGPGDEPLVFASTRDSGYRTLRYTAVGQLVDNEPWEASMAFARTGRETIRGFAVLPDGAIAVLGARVFREFVTIVGDYEYVATAYVDIREPSGESRVVLRLGPDWPSRYAAIAANGSGNLAITGGDDGGTLLLVINQQGNVLN